MMFRALTRLRLWPALVAVLVAAQMALSFHAVEHALSAAPPEECVICHVTHTATPGPSAAAIATPNLYLLARIIAFVPPLPSVSVSPAGFLARAPPASVSV